MAQAPEFIERDLEVIISEMVADYEQRTGRTLHPAQVERLLINSFAYRESLVREKIQYAASQNLVDFASAPVLDYLGQLVGVSRLASSAATVTIEFTLVTGHGGVTIPQGTRVSTTDGVAVFETTIDEIVSAGASTATVEAVCIDEGSAGNGYAVGTITEIMDPLAFVSEATNTDISGGGAEQEDDEALRERIKLAPASFSNAGSRGAYEFFALSASPSIIDVAVLGPPDIAPGQVEIYPLMEDGSVTSPTVLTAVDAAVNSEKVRPLTDTVTVIAPTQVTYAIDVDVTILTEADPTTVQAAIEEKLNAFVLAKRQKLGQDILLTQVISQCMVEGVYTVDVIEPSANVILSAVEFGYATAITVTIAGTNNG